MTNLIIGPSDFTEKYYRIQRNWFFTRLLFISTISPWTENAYIRYSSESAVVGGQTGAGVLNDRSNYRATWGNADQPSWDYRRTTEHESAGRSHDETARWCLK